MKRIISVLLTIGLIIPILFSQNSNAYGNQSEKYVSISDGVIYQYKELAGNRNEICITNIVSKNNTVLIPERISGKKVVAIGDGDIEFSGHPKEDILYSKSEDAEKLKESFCVLLENAEIENIVLPKTVTRIHMCSFYGCDSLKRVTFPEGLLSIGEEVFANCTNIDQIYIPKSVEKIYAGAFQGCRNIKKVTVKSKSVNIYSRAFQGIAGKVILGAGKTKRLSGIFFQWKNNPTKVNCVTWRGDVKHLEVMENTFEYSRIRNLVIPSFTKSFTMWQQEMMLCDYLVLTGMDTEVSKDTVMGDDPKAYYINAKAIVAQKGARVLKYASRFKRPCIEKLDINNEKDVMLLDGDGHYTETNIGMRDVKVIIINPPKRPTVKKSGNKLKWKENEGVSEYWVYYSKTKKGVFKKIKSLKSCTYTIQKEGYYKIRGVKRAYGAVWKGKISKKYFSKQRDFEVKN